MAFLKNKVMMAELLSILTGWLLFYGAPILFILLVLGIVGLPIPDETLLTLSGYLIAKGKLHPIAILIAAITGSIAGITVSYWLGRSAGPWLIKKFGSKLRITEKKLAKMNHWYNRFGKWILLVGYFIPVVRHLAGFVAGESKLNFKTFMLLAYTGAIIWSITFLYIGYIMVKAPS